jgi:hypothetical protein
LRAPVAELGLGEQTELAGAVGFPTIRFPERPIRGGRRLPVAFVVESASPEALYLELASVRLADGTELLQEPATAIVPPTGRSELRATLVMPSTMAAGRHELEVELAFAGGLRASPSRGVIVVDYTGRPGIAAGALGRARAGGASLIFVLVAAAAVALVVLVALGLRSHVDLGSWIRSLGYSEGRYTRERAGGHPLIEMIVTMQNRHIGHRNVHSIPLGSSRSVGGGRSSYLIYFVSVPAGIAYVTCDGNTYTFVPVRADLFPGVAGPVADCLGRDIPAISPRGYAFTIVFRQFRSPLEEINDLLRSIRVQEG